MTNILGDGCSVLALDFDGVICDGMEEYYHSAWLVYCQLWSLPLTLPPAELFPIFAQLRPLIEHGWEMPLLVWALQNNLSATHIAQDWNQLVGQILANHNLKSKDVVKVLDAVRDQAISTDLLGWLKLQHCYPGTIDRLLSLPPTIKPVIITTKDGRFTRQFLENQGVNLPTDAIFGKEIKQSKVHTLRQLLVSRPEKIWFVEDRLPTLQAVAQQDDLDSVQLFLADWGYNTPAERAIAQEDPRIQLLSLAQFSQDLSCWSTPDARSE